MHKHDVKLDTSDLVCPLPLLKTKQAMADMQKGQVIEVICTDASSVVDFESFVAITGATMLKREQNGAQYIFVIRK